jgi:hypothetical protein
MMGVRTAPQSTEEVMGLYEGGFHQWSRMTVEQLAGEIELCTIMPGNNRADYLRAAAMCLHLAERMKPQ